MDLETKEYADIQTKEEYNETHIHNRNLISDFHMSSFKLSMFMLSMWITIIILFLF